MSHPIDLPKFISAAHRLIEANEGGARISRSQMSERLGISVRTLTEYERGANQPTGMKALLLLLAQLRDEQIVRLIRQFEENEVEESRDES